MQTCVSHHSDKVVIFFLPTVIFYVPIMRKTFIEKISIDGQTFRTYKQKEKQMKIKDQKKLKIAHEENCERHLGEEGQQSLVRQINRILQRGT